MFDKIISVAHKPTAGISETVRLSIIFIGAFIFGLAIRLLVQ